MDFRISFSINKSVCLRDPEHSELGQKIVKHAIDLIHEFGFEGFTFRKLAIHIGTTEASIYRYFENKHRLLLYIISWYWKYLDFLLDFQVSNINNPKLRIQTIIQLLTNELPEGQGGTDYNKKRLHQIVMSESSKVYLIKEVEAINKNEVFQPYKDLCSRIAEHITLYNKDYPYPKSLGSTIIETAHHQQFFCSHLPRLTDTDRKNHPEYVCDFLEDMVFRILDKK